MLPEPRRKKQRIARPARGRTPAPWWARGVLKIGLAMFKGVLVLVMGKVRSSWAFKEAVELARRHPRLGEALGGSIETGWLVSGSIRVAGQKGTAKLAIPIRGDRADGTLFVLASKTEGRWQMDRCEAGVVGRRERIDLLVGAPDPLLIDI